MALEKKFDDIDETDLERLIENKISEQKTIEYKRILPGNKYDSKKEFLADVSSFANTLGGHIIYGVIEENGLPIEFSGLENVDFDSEILRLENLLRDSIQPRIQGISIKTIVSMGGKPLVILRIPQSWSKPHVVNHQGHWRFYARNSAGKYQLDISEVKSAFLSSTAIIDRIKKFRFERISKIIADETPIALESGSKTIFHLLPFISFDTGFSIELSSLKDDLFSLNPFYSSASGSRYNLDGLATFDKRGDGRSTGYFQVYRNGIVEIVSKAMADTDDSGPYIPSEVFEQELVNALSICLSLYKKIQIVPPVALILTLTGIKNYRLAVNINRLDPWRQHTHKFDRDLLAIPEIVVENYSDSPASILRPVFDSLWNSAGWARSMGYDEDGEWGKGPNFR